ncbi:hypothetical protein CEP52_007870 [Fusarium oligoseptatum]|uniref:Uncharacterized protein n=1 Tax=Fusarium oligoseptatum TaxID=2604345 RepID=A0A428TKM2_9HYPO|nr:hypothetical protein CEP52_007870 [Fusarium oligoseptatum]
MHLWPFTLFPPKGGSKVPVPKDEKGKEGDLPWHSQIISYLQFKEVLLTEIRPEAAEWEQYRDPPNIGFFTQFSRLKLFLDAKLLKPNGRAQLVMEQADPGFRKIQMISEWADYCRNNMGYDQEPPVTSFPEEWRDESYFLNWMWLNVFFQLTSLDTETVERAAHIVMHTNYIQVWNSYGAKHNARIKGQEEEEAFWVAYEEHKANEKLEKERKRHEEMLLKEIRAQRRLDRERYYE